MAARRLLQALRRLIPARNPSRLFAHGVFPHNMSRWYTVPMNNRGEMVLRNFRWAIACCCAVLCCSRQAAADNLPPILFSPPFPDLQWYYDNPGDYNQDGLVNASDLTALGRHFGEKAQGGQFDPSDARSLIDGDNNGEINLADLMIIARNWGCSALGGYSVKMSGAAAPLGHVPFAASLPGNPLAERKRFAFTVTPTAEVRMDRAYSADPVAAGDAPLPACMPARIVLPSPPVTGADLLEPAASYSEPDGQPLTRFTWHYANLADGGQDGTVTVADLQPLVANLGAVAMFGSSGWGPGNRLALVDSDCNGELSLADAVTLGEYYGRTVSGYHLYVTDGVAHYPANPWDLSNLPSFATIGFDAAVNRGNAGFQRLLFQSDAAADLRGKLWWVRPYAPGGWEGAPSAIGAV
jgi:hypothetical protein